VTYHLTQLTSGLRVATESLPHVESVALSFSVDVGARYETDAECGLSHILEHMAFKGTATRSARDIAEQFDAIGGHFNAYTSMEHTVYYAKVLAEHTDVALDILTDILANSTVDAAELRREQDVIVQEIGMHLDSPEDLVTELYDEIAFPNQPMGRSILGTAEQVMRYTRDDVLAYQRKHYAPSRMVFSAAGKLEHGALAERLEQFIPKSEPSSNYKAPSAAYRGGEVVHQKDLEQTHVLLGMESIASSHADIYALNLLTSILGGGMSSRLFQEIREKRGLVYHVSAQSAAYSDTGMFSMYAATEHAKADEAISVMRSEFERLAQDITEEELARAKAQQRAELMMSRENPATIAAWIGRHLLIHGEYRTLPMLLKRIEAVEISDLKRLANTLLSRPQTLAKLGG
jgi:predicted Zn-dependent peptidase